MSANLFRQYVATIPKEIDTEVRLSDAIADKIYSTLKERGISQKEFAKQVGKSELEVARWVSGEHNFSLRTLALISNALNINLISVK